MRRGPRLRRRRRVPIREAGRASVSAAPFAPGRGAAGAPPSAAGGGVWTCEAPAAPERSRVDMGAPPAAEGVRVVERPRIKAMNPLMSIEPSVCGIVPIQSKMVMGQGGDGPGSSWARVSVGQGGGVSPPKARGRGFGSIGM